MERTLSGLVILIAACAGRLRADDFRLVVETRGCENLACETVPDDLPLRNRIVLRIRSGERFETSVLLDDVQLDVSGILRSDGDDAWKIEIAYTEQRPTGQVVPTNSGKPEPVVDVTSVRSRLTIEPGKAVRLGGLHTQSTAATDAVSHSATKVEHWLQVSPLSRNGANQNSSD